MKNNIFLFLLFIFTCPLFSQDVKIDILDAYTVIIDKGSIKQRDGKIYLKIHNMDDDKVLKSSLSVSPDSAYSSHIVNNFKEQFEKYSREEIMPGLKKELMTFMQPNQEIDQEAMNEFLNNYMYSKLHFFYSKNIKINKVLVEFLAKRSTTFFFENLKRIQSNQDASDNFNFNKNITYNIIIDCDKKTLQFESMKTLDNDLEIIHFPNEIRKIEDSDPRGSNYRLFHKICNQQY